MLVLGKDKYESDLDLTIFEEFMDFKPENKIVGEPWFNKDQKQTRINLLTKCIEMTNEETTT